MKLTAHLPDLAMTESHTPIKFVELNQDKKKLGLRTELQWLNHVLEFMLYVTLVIAIASFTCSLSYRPAVALVSTGFLAVLASITIVITRIQLRTNKNLTEVCIMTLCSVYAPFFVLWIASGNLLAVIISKV